MRIFLLLIPLSFLYSCAPNFFLKENQKIEELTLGITYGEKINEADQKLIEFNVNQFLEERASFTEYSFALSRTYSPNPDVTLNFERVRSPSKGIKIAGIVISAGSLFLIITNPTITPYIWIFTTFTQTFNSTICNVQMNPNISTRPEKSTAVNFYSPRRWQRREVEISQHLKATDHHLDVLFNMIEKEYLKRNK